MRVCVEEPTKAMLKNAVEARFHTLPMNAQHPRIQIFSIEDLLAGTKVDMLARRDPRTFKRAPKAKGKEAEDANLF